MRLAPGQSDGCATTTMIRFDLVVTACSLANAAGLVAAALAARRCRLVGARPRLPSFAVGVLLGVVLLDLISDLWGATVNLATLLSLFAAALLASRLLDRACACGHLLVACQSVKTEHHHHVEKVHWTTRGSELLLVGDFVHSFVDGSLSVAALAVGIVPGAVATMAVAIHEVPPRVVVVTLLVRAGCRPPLTMVLTKCATMGTVMGDVLAWWLAAAIHPALPVARADSGVWPALLGRAPDH